MHRNSYNSKDPSLAIVLIVLLAVLFALFSYLKKPATTANESFLSLSAAQALPLDIGSFMGHSLCSALNGLQIIVSVPLIVRVA